MKRLILGIRLNNVSGDSEISEGEMARNCCDNVATYKSQGD